MYFERISAEANDLYLDLLMQAPLDEWEETMLDLNQMPTGRLAARTELMQAGLVVVRWNEEEGRYKWLIRSAPTR